MFILRRQPKFLTDVKSFDWIDSIIDTPLRIEDGFAYPREGAGWGFRFKEQALSEIS